MLHILLSANICGTCGHSPRRASGQIARVRRFLVWISLTVCCCASWTPPSHAVGFIIDNDSTFFPSYDPDGSRLTSILEAAAIRYNRIFRDNWSISLSFRYAPPGGTSRLANTSIHGVEEVTLPVGIPAERAVFASVEFNSDALWYFDDTPLDDIEFDLASMSYAQLSLERKASGFAGEPPQRLEVSYEGTAQDGVEGIDALSVAMHELGHVLGVAGSFAEADDGDYDLNAALVHGAEVGVLTSAGDPNHLQVRGSLMDATVSARMRTLPAAVDIFAMASSSGWQQIDLPRKEFWGGRSEPGGSGDAAWLHPFNWSGGRLPDAEDEVMLRSGGNVLVGDGPGGSALAGRLFLDEGTTLTLAGGRLAAGQLHLGPGGGLAQLGGGATGDRLFVDPTSTVSFELNAPAHTPFVFLEGIHLAGTLEILLATDYAPTAGDAQTLLATQHVAGGFDRVVVVAADELRDLAVLLDLQETLLPGLGSLHSLVARVVLQGDTNADGKVDQADLDAVLLGWGESVMPAHVGSGDTDGNGRIDQADLDRVLLNWGRSAGGIAVSGTAIPEPATAGLALLLFGGVVRRLRRFPQI